MNNIIMRKDVEIIYVFKYLWSSIISTEKDVKNRISLAWVAFTKLKKLLIAPPPKPTMKFTQLSSFFNLSVCFICFALWLRDMGSNETQEEELDVLLNHTGNYTSRCPYDKQGTLQTDQTTFSQRDHPQATARVRGPLSLHERERTSLHLWHLSLRSQW